MKVLIYFVLIIAFLMFYQQNPVFAVVIVALFIGLYLFFKARKSRGLSVPGSFLSGSRGSQDTTMDDYMKIFMMQQVISPGSHSIVQASPASHKLNKRQEQIEATKNEILELLES